MIRNACRIGGTVVIGFTPENNVREFAFDIRKYIDAWPECTPEMLVVRPGEDVARPVVTRVEDGQIIWSAKRHDTQIPGTGRMWIVFHDNDGETLGATPATMVSVMSGPPNIDGEEPPATEIPWVSKVIEAAKRAEDAADRVENAGGGGNGTGGITKEVDPTVPDWAKQPTKPKYTAEEIGALPDTTVIPTVPSALPNPQPLVINGVEYDGKEKKEVTINAGSGGAVIDDNTPSATTTYSSQKIEAELSAQKDQNDNLILHTQALTDGQIYYGYIRGADGTEYDMDEKAAYRYGDYIPLTDHVKGRDVEIFCSLVSNAGVAFYDEKKTFISGVNGNNAPDAGYEAGTAKRIFRIPDGSAFVRFTLQLAYYQQPSDFKVKYLKIPGISEVEECGKDVAALESMIADFVDDGVLVTLGEYEQGNLNGTKPMGSAELASDLAIRSVDYIEKPGRYIVRVGGGQKVYVYKYNKETGAMEGNYGWGIATDFTFDLDAEHFARIVIMLVDGTAITPEECAVTITKTTFVDSMVIKKNPMCLTIAHQGYLDGSGTTNNSRLSGYKRAAERGFDVGETDVKLTSDGYVVCCHDATFADATTGETVTIATSTLSKLRSHNYYGETIATLDEVVQECKKYGMGLCLDQLGTADIIRKAYASVKKAGMLDKTMFCVTVGATDAAALIQSLYSKATIMVISSSASLAEHIAFANSLDNGTNTVYVYAPRTVATAEEFGAAAETMSNGVKLAVWTLNVMDYIKAFMPYVSAWCSDKYSYHDAYLNL